MFNIICLGIITYIYVFVAVIYAFIAMPPLRIVNRGNEDEDGYESDNSLKSFYFDAAERVEPAIHEEVDDAAISPVEPAIRGMHEEVDDAAISPVEPAIRDMHDVIEDVVISPVEPAIRDMHDVVEDAGKSPHKILTDSTNSCVLVNKVDTYNSPIKRVGSTSANMHEIVNKFSLPVTEKAQKVPEQWEKVFKRSGNVFRRIKIFSKKLSPPMHYRDKNPKL